MLKINKFIILLITTILLVGCYNQNTQRNIPISPVPISNENSQTWKIETSTWQEKSKETNKPIAYNWINKTDLPLKVTDNFTVSIFAKDLGWARDLVWPDKIWNYYLSRTSKWIITMLEVKDSKVVSKTDILKNLNNPHWLALDPQDKTTLYFAETNKLSKIKLYSDWKSEKIIDLPKWWRHFTRSLIFGTDSKLYVSIWSTCDVCYEKNEMNATIYRLDKDWKNLEKVASWLRNSVFMDVNPISGEIWATEMWRDNLWDNIPPDEINIIKKWNNYWWPICYGNNIHDYKFDKRTYIANPCMYTKPSHIDLQAHSAPLWIAFIPKEWWPENYSNDLLVAYHWSWNRSIPTGYKIVHIKLDDLWNVIEQRDFITWFINEKNDVLGRPVDILTQTWWVAFVTDDKKWVVYKISYNK